MKFLAGNKVLGALLAAVAVGMGAQTYYLVRVHRQLGAAEARAAELDALERDRVAREAAPAPALSPGPLDPFEELERTEARLRGLFEDLNASLERGFGASSRHPFFADGDSFLFGPAGQLGPRVDLQDRGDRYELLVDIPGTDEAEVSVTAQDGSLVIQGSRSTSVEESRPGSFVRRERQFGRFERRLPLPADADPATIETAYEDGVLRVTIRKLG